MSSTSNSTSSGSRWARTKTKTFEKSWKIKPLGHSRAPKKSKEMPHFHHFSRPREIDPYMHLQFNFLTFSSEWTPGKSIVEDSKWSLQFHKGGDGVFLDCPLGRLWHPGSRWEPAQRYSDGHLHDAEDFWTVSSNHKCWYTSYCSDNKSWCPMGSQTWLQILGATLGFSSVSPVLLFLTISASWQPNCLWLWIISNRTIFVESLIMTTKFLIYANLLYMIWNE